MMTENDAIYILKNYKFDARQKGFFDMVTAISIAISALKEIQQYRSIGTVEECREAAEKQKTMKVNEVHVDEYYCPACGSENNCDQGEIWDRYCPNCGQAIAKNLEGLENEG